jgi:hypothetical protein
MSRQLRRIMVATGQSKGFAMTALARKTYGVELLPSFSSPKPQVKINI